MARTRDWAESDSDGPPSHQIWSSPFSMRSERRAVLRSLCRGPMHSEEDSLVCAYPKHVACSRSRKVYVCVPVSAFAGAQYLWCSHAAQRTLVSARTRGPSGPIKILMRTAPTSLAMGDVPGETHPHQTSRERKRLKPILLHCHGSLADTPSG